MRLARPKMMLKGSGGLRTTKKTQPSFHAILTDLINATGLTVNAFCEKHSLSQSSIQSYVAGKSRPTWDKVQQLAKALGVSTDVFRDK